MGWPGLRYSEAPAEASSVATRAPGLRGTSAPATLAETRCITWAGLNSLADRVFRTGPSSRRENHALQTVAVTAAAPRRRAAGRRGRFGRRGLRRLARGQNPLRDAGQ